MDRLTVREAAQTTGWSPRMLRYIEAVGLVAADRSAAGYRLYGPAELQRLRTLRELLTTHGVELSEVGFARRMRLDDRLRAAIDGWIVGAAHRPAAVAPAEWLRFEQHKHERLLAGLRTPTAAVPDPDDAATDATDDTDDIDDPLTATHRGRPPRGTAKESA